MPYFSNISLTPHFSEVLRMVLPIVFRFEFDETVERFRNMLARAINT